MLIFVDVVPLAIPVIVEPPTIGALLVSASEIQGVQLQILGILALFFATGSLVIIFMLGLFIERAVGHLVINILSKITGLILAALSAQMGMSGIKHFFQPT